MDWANAAGVAVVGHTGKLAKLSLVEGCVGENDTDCCVGRRSGLSGSDVFGRVEGHIIHKLLAGQIVEG